MVALDKTFMLEQDAERLELAGIRSKWQKDALFQIQCKVRRAKADLSRAQTEREKRAE